MQHEQMIRNILAAYPNDVRAEHVFDLRTPLALGECRHWKIDTEEGMFCLRRWPRNEPGRDRLQFLQAILWHAVYEGFDMVPLPYETAENKGFIEFDGFFWELLPWIEGDVPDQDDCFLAEPSVSREPLSALPVFSGSTESKEDRMFRIASALMSLAQFHLAVADFPLPHAPISVSPSLSSLTSAWQEGIAGGLTRIFSLLRDLSEPSVPELRRLARRGIEWINASISISGSSMVLLTRGKRLAVPIQPVIGNACRRHLRFDEEGVCGMIDLKEIAVDSVSRDIASLLGSMAQSDASLWNFGLKAYQSIRPLSDNELFLVRVFDLPRLCFEGVEHLRRVFIEQVPFTVPQLLEMTGRLERGLARLESENENRDLRTGG